MEPPSRHSGWQTRELLDLAASSKHGERPCAACDVECEFDKRRDCLCRCVPTCEAARHRLVAGEEAVDPAILPLAFALATLHHVALEKTEALASGFGIVFYSSSTALPSVFAHWLGELSATRLRARWRLLVQPDLRGRSIYLLEAEGPRDAISADARLLGDELGDALPALALREMLRTFPQLDQLTAREKQVLRHFLDGLSVSTIAQHLYVSEHTVRNHLKAIFSKAGVASQAELRERFAGRSEPARRAFSFGPPR